jgi:predicted dehydrogenase
MTLRVLLFGLGQVAMGYDLDSHDADLVLTHAKAFSLHPDFALQGGVDPDAARCAVFEERYGGHAGTDLVAALAAAQPDVVVVASPTPHHGTAVRTILEHGAPKLILCEKPLSYDRAEARAMVDACREHGCLLFVNYLRRVDPGVREIGRRLADGIEPSSVTSAPFAPVMRHAAGSAAATVVRAAASHAMQSEAARTSEVPSITCGSR